MVSKAVCAFPPGLMCFFPIDTPYLIFKDDDMVLLKKIWNLNGKPLYIFRIQKKIQTEDMDELILLLSILEFFV